MIKNKLGKYNLPTLVQYCKNCTRSNQRPHNMGEFNQKINEKKKYVGLNKKGLCGACEYYFEKDKIDWNKREIELEKLCNKYRKKDGNFDVIVPGSGGKDSVFVAHQLRNKYKMNPLLVTWRPAIYTDIGKKNYLSWLKLAKSNYSYSQNKKVHRLLTKLAFENLCHPFQPFILGQKNFAPKVAIKFNIKLIMYGESYVEFGMSKKTKNQPKMDEKYYSSDENLKNLYISGIKVKDLIKKYKLSYSDLKIYLPLNRRSISDNNIKFYNYSYFKKWNFHDNYYYALKNSEFKPNNVRLEGSYDKYASMDDKMDWLHFYTFYIKFGMGRTTAATDQEIRSGVITRDEGISLVKRFDGEYPKMYLNDILKYMNISKSRFEKIIDKARPRHLWQKKNNKWFLKKPIWKVK